jgi:hypothetical protein
LLAADVRDVLLEALEMAPRNEAPGSPHDAVEQSNAVPVAA